MAVVAEEAVVSRVEVDVLLAVASEGCIPGSEHRELTLHSVDVNLIPCARATSTTPKAR